MSSKKNEKGLYKARFTIYPSIFVQGNVFQLPERNKQFFRSKTNSSNFKAKKVKIIMKREVKNNF